MAGKQTNGTATDSPLPRESRAYCEGRQHAAASGTLTYDSGTTGVEGNNNGLTWTAADFGMSNIKISLTDPGVAGASIAVSADVRAKEITVALGTGAAGNITTGVEGNNNAITWTPVVATQRYSVALVDPSAADQSLSVVVSGSDITVNLATDGGSAITSTAAQVIAAIEADEDASALVTVDNTGASTGAGVVVAESDAIGALASTAGNVITAVEASSAASSLVGVDNTGASTGAAVPTAEIVVLSGASPKYVAGPDADAFEAGHTSWTANPAAITTRDDCAQAYGGGYS